MYIEHLRIFPKNKKDDIRKITFKKGMNFIIDGSSSHNEKGNNVGKTTTLKLIDIALGSTDKKYLWLDADTKSENENLKAYINEQQLIVELLVSQNNKDYFLQVDLFENGRRRINSEPCGEKKYCSELNSIAFNLSGKPSFRQLIKKFIRINLKNDNYSVFNYLHATTSFDIYQSIYRFLFSLTDNNTNEKILNLKTQIKDYESNITNLFQLNKIKNINELKQRIGVLNNSIEKKQHIFRSFINSENYNQFISKNLKVKEMLNSINDKIDFLKFQIEKFSSIKENEEKEKTAIDDDILRDFYNEIENKFTGNLQHSFEDLVMFNSKMRSNKLTYYTKRTGELNTEIEELLIKQKTIINENEDILKLFNKNDYEDFEKKYADILRENEQLASLKSVKKIYSENYLILSGLQSQLETLDTDIEQDNLTVFNEVFSELSYSIFNKRLYLSSNDDGFPIELSNIDDGLGTGDRKALALIFDTAYVSFLNKLELNYPKFFIHDVLESMDSQNFKKVTNEINSNGSQFICAVLKEKIDRYDFLSEDDVRLVLSENNKLFKL
ncbi:hypothetical protein [Psychrobacillus sp.]|uniref:hypothetical protein n=1 Tax=Psychrobacillus sp. TaxID=1871623 RepID=UPI0028BD5B84|nr:hypothetical protein [Psychrobacillus sp.]